MKYCVKCGKQLNDDDVFCSNCGAQQSSLKNTEEAIYGKDANRVLRTVAFVFMVISTVICGFLLFPLCWMLPMTIHYYHAMEDNRQVSTSFKVCSLLFVSLIGGIIMLCDDLN